MIRQLIRLHYEESGQVLILTCMSMMLLLGFMALAIDTGLLFRARRNLQIAADAAATAGALDYHYNSSATSAESAGQDAATANGFTDGVNGASVTINVPPQNGPDTGTTGFVEAIVTQSVPTYFLKLFHPANFTVAARAVAGLGYTSSCVWALDGSGTDVTITGAAAVSIPGCSIYADSTSDKAVSLTGSSSLTAQSVYIVGNYNTTGVSTVTPNPVTGVSPFTDPLSYLQAPTYSTSGCSAAQSYSGVGNYTLGPGCYNGISVAGSTTLTTQPGNYIINGDFSLTGATSATLGAGLYIITGNLKVTASTTLSGTGVTIYSTGSTTVSGAGSMDLTAPTSGTYNGVLFFQQRGDAQTISLTGSGAMNLQGIIYAPSAPLKLSGGSTGTIYTDLVVDSLTFTGSANLHNYALINSASDLSTVVLAE